jgi:hypothetical protein
MGGIGREGVRAGAVPGAAGLLLMVAVWTSACSTNATLGVTRQPMLMSSVAAIGNPEFKYSCPYQVSPPKMTTMRFWMIATSSSGSGSGGGGGWAETASSAAASVASSSSGGGTTQAGGMTMTGAAVDAFQLDSVGLVYTQGVESRFLRNLKVRVASVGFQFISVMGEALSAQLEGEVCIVPPAEMNRLRRGAKVGTIPEDQLLGMMAQWDRERLAGDETINVIVMPGRKVASTATGGEP